MADIIIVVALVKRAEVIRLIEQELAAVDDIKAAFGAVLSPAPKRR